MFNSCFDIQNLARCFSLKWLGDLKEAKKTDVTFAGGLRTMRPIETSFFSHSYRSSKYHIKKQKSIIFCKICEAIFFSSQHWQWLNWSISNSCSGHQSPEKLWAGRRARSGAEVRSCRHENLRKQFKIFSNIKANLRGNMVTIAAEQPVYYLCTRTGWKQQV